MSLEQHEECAPEQLVIEGEKGEAVAAKELRRASPPHAYLIEKHNGDITRYSDLGLAFAALEAASDSENREWRIHYHIPLFLDDLSPFSSTQSFVREALALHRQDPISQHLEVETYTWGVLPARYRTTSLALAIARELQWVRQRFPA